MCEEKNVGMYTLQMEAAPVVVSPFVQCELVAPRWFRSPTSKYSCSVGVNSFIGSGFICICSEELCGARIEGHCGWPQYLGSAPVQGSTPHTEV